MLMRREPTSSVRSELVHCPSARDQSAAVDYRCNFSSCHAGAEGSAARINSGQSRLGSAPRHRKAKEGPNHGALLVSLIYFVTLAPRRSLALV